MDERRKAILRKANLRHSEKRKQEQARLPEMHVSHAKKAEIDRLKDNFKISNKEATLLGLELVFRCAEAGIDISKYLHKHVYGDPREVTESKFTEKSKELIEAIKNIEPKGT